MKISYKKLIVFMIFILAILVLNSFVSNILSNYNMILFLALLLIIFKISFGFERDRHRYTKDIIMDILVFLLIYFIIYYLLGIIISFAKTENYYNFIGMKNFIIPTIITIILTEVLRYMMIVKIEENKYLMILVCLLFIALDITNVINYQIFKFKYDSFKFVALTLIPSISKNVMCTYMSTKIGYKPTIFYLLVIGLYRFLLPIIPNPSEYLSSIVELITPMIICYIVYRFFSKIEDSFSERKKRDFSLIALIPLVIFIVYFTSGYFKFYAVAIASGSMMPNINKGDVVIIEKINDYNKIKEGQVIAYKYNDVIVVHRLQRIIKEREKFYFYTKGDANSMEDPYVIYQEMIVGIVNIKVPYLGIPTVWLNEL